MISEGEQIYRVGLAFFLAFVQVHHITIAYSPDDLNANIHGAIGVTTGHPYWRVHQSRVLGPYVLKGLVGLFSGDHVSSYIILMTAVLTLAGYQAWRIGSKFGEGKAGWLSLAVLHLSFAFLFSKPWLPLYSFISLNIFLAFVDFVISERPWYWFCALFAIAILNRESGLFIALWMILEPSCRWFIRRPLPKHASLIMVIAGVLCIGIGLWITDYLRTTLLVKETASKILEYGPNFFWALPRNLIFLQHIFQAHDLAGIVSTSLPLLVLALVIFLVGIISYKELRYLALAMTYAASAVAVLLFGFIFETNVFVEFIPLVILGSCLLIYPEGIHNSKLPTRIKGPGITVVSTLRERQIRAANLKFSPRRVQ